MDLPLDPTLPVAGIMLILVLVWLTGGRRRACLADGETAQSLLAQPELGFAPAEIVVAEDGAGAIAVDAAGRLALVFPAGARLAARPLKPGEVIRHHVETLPDGRARLHLATRGPGGQVVALLLPLAVALSWQQRLAA